MNQKLLRNSIIFLFIIYVSTLHNFAFLVQKSAILGVGVGRISLVFAILISSFVKSYSSISNQTSIRFLRLTFYSIFILILVKVSMGIEIMAFKIGIYDLINFLWIIPLSRAINTSKDINQFFKLLLIYVTAFSATITLFRLFGFVPTPKFGESKAIVGNESGGMIRYMVANAYIGILGFYYGLTRLNSWELSKNQKLIYLIMVIIFFAGLILSYSRKLYLFIFLGGAIVFIFSRRKQLSIVAITRTLLISGVFYIIVSFIYQVSNLNIDILFSRIESIFTDVGKQSGTYGSRLGYIEKQFDFWEKEPIYFILGVNFTKMRESLNHLLFTNNGITEEILMYGVIVALLFLYVYLNAAYICFRVYSTSNSWEVRSFAIVVVAFMFCSLIIHPILFSLFHNPLNIAGTVIVLVIANKLDVLKSIYK